MTTKHRIIFPSLPPVPVCLYRVQIYYAIQKQQQKKTFRFSYQRGKPETSINNTQKGFSYFSVNNFSYDAWFSCSCFPPLLFDKSFRKHHKSITANLVCCQQHFSKREEHHLFISQKLAVNSTRTLKISVGLPWLFAIWNPALWNPASKLGFLQIRC